MKLFTVLHIYDFIWHCDTDIHKNFTVFIIGHFTNDSDYVWPGISLDF